MTLRLWVTLSLAIAHRLLGGLGAGPRLRRRDRVQYRLRSDLRHVSVAEARDVLPAPELTEVPHPRLHDVDRGGGAGGLRQDVLDPRALDERAHGTARDDARSRSGRLQQHDAGA